MKPAVDVADDADVAKKLLAQHKYQIVCTDLQMPGFDGIQFLRRVQAKRRPIAVIIITDQATIEQAVLVMRLGAHDVLVKPVDASHLQEVVEQAYRERALQFELDLLRDYLQQRFTTHTVVSKNLRMHEILGMLARLAQTSSTILLEGAPGTGKALLAQAIHEASGSNGALKIIDCRSFRRSLLDHLLEGELLGYDNPPFPGGLRAEGNLEVSRGETLFFDEVGSLPMWMQARLLRIVQTRMIEPLGGADSTKNDVRVIASTSRPLWNLVARGKFRHELFYRLNVVRLELPPLQERAEDIPILAASFIEKYTNPDQPRKQFSPEAMRKLVAHDWPGNLRQLENAVQCACLVAPTNLIQVKDLPAEIVSPDAGHNSRVDLDRPLPDVLRGATAQLERAYLVKAMRKARGNVGDCAKTCGLSRRSISSKLAAYKIDKEDFKTR